MYDIVAQVGQYLRTGRRWRSRILATASGLYRREAWRAWSIALDVQKKETIPFIEITVETQGRPRCTSAMSARVTQRASSLAPEPVVGEDS
jgi:hypothetical protein